MSSLIPYQPTPPAATVHVRLDGKSESVSLALLDLGPDASDAAVKQALAGYFNQPLTAFEALVIERHANGNLTVRPEAVFG